LRSVPLLGAMALPVAAVVYLVGRVTGLWAGPLRPGRAAWTGSLAAVVGLFPAAMMLGLFYEIPMPFASPVSGPAAIMSAPLIVLFFGVLGGFPVVAFFGAVAGAAVYAVTPRSRQNPDGPGERAAGLLLMSVATILIDYGCIECFESRSTAPAGTHVTGSFFLLFLSIALLGFSILYVRDRVARRGTGPLPPGIFVFGSCLFLGLVLGVVLAEVTGFVVLGLVVGTVAGGILGVKDRLSPSTKAPRSPTHAGVGDRDLD
jgi:hypothetical protein